MRNELSCCGLNCKKLRHTMFLWIFPKKLAPFEVWLTQNFQNKRPCFLAIKKNWRPVWSQNNNRLTIFISVIGANGYFSITYLYHSISFRRSRSCFVKNQTKFIYFHTQICLNIYEEDIVKKGWNHAFGNRACCLSLMAATVNRDKSSMSSWKSTLTHS